MGGDDFQQGFGDPTLDGPADGFAGLVIQIIFHRVENGSEFIETQGGDFQSFHFADAIFYDRVDVYFGGNEVGSLMRPPQWTGVKVVNGLLTR